MIRISKIFKGSEEGFSLLEALLVVGVSSVILLGSVQLANDWAEQIVDIEEAEYIVTIADAADGFVNANFADIWTTAMGETFDPGLDGIFTNADINNLGRVIRIDVSGPAATGLPANYTLQDPASGTLPVGFPNVSPLNFSPRIFIRNMGYVNENRILELYVMTDSVSGNMLSIARANRIAGNIGTQGASISRIDPNTATPFAGGFCTAANVFGSIFGTWQISMDAFNNSPVNALNIDNSYCPATQPGANNQGSYVALRRVLEFDAGIIGDVLYRVAIPGQPDANRMQANLDMNGQNITNVGAMSADSMRVQGNMTMQGNAATTYVEETTRIAGAGSTLRARPVPGGFAPDPNCGWDPGNPGQLDPSVAGAGTCDLVGGNLSVTTGNAASGLDSVVATAVTAPAASLTANRIISINTLNVGNQALISGTAIVNSATTGGVAANNLNVVSNIDTSSLQSSQLNNTTSIDSQSMISGSLGVSGTLNTPSLTVSQDSSGGQGVLQSSGTVVIGNGLTANQAAIDNLGGCQATVIHRFDLDNDRNYYEIPGDFENGVPSYDCVLGP